LNTNFEKLEKVRSATIIEISNDFKYKLDNINTQKIEAEKILEKIENICDHEYDVEFSHYGRCINFSGVKSKLVYERFIIALTELYSEGTKSELCGDIQYEFYNRTNQTYIKLRVSPKVTGCRLVTGEVLIPEKVEPEHYETKTVVKCD
jgi:hypothetical protein